MFKVLQDNVPFTKRYLPISHYQILVGIEIFKHKSTSTHSKHNRSKTEAGVVTLCELGHTERSQAPPPGQDCT